MIGFILIMVWMWKRGKASGMQRNWQWLKSWAALLGILFLWGCLTTALSDPRISGAEILANAAAYTFAMGVLAEIWGTIAWLIGRFGTSPANPNEDSNGNS